MANGYFERGEIYWVKMGMGVGAEMNVTRPGLIVSCNDVNNSSEAALVVFLTTKEHRTTWNRVMITATGRESWVLCDQIQTVDKSRFTKHLGTLNSAEMRAVEDALEEVFDLGYADTAAMNEKDREIEARDAVIVEKDAEIAALKAKVAEVMAARENDIASSRIENEMFRKLYERSLDTLVDMKFGFDLARRSEKRDEQPEPKVEQPESDEADLVVNEADLVNGAKLVDINHCTITALKKLGLSVALAKAVANSRPFSSVEDLKRVNGMKATMYRILEKKVCCTPIIEEPVEEPVAEPVEIPQEVENTVTVKVNVNTASAQEISDVTGMTLNAAFAITGKRRKDGLFKSLDELVIPRRISEKMLAKYRDKMEV